MGTKLFVGNLAYSTTDERIQQAFTPAGGAGVEGPQVQEHAVTMDEVGQIGQAILDHALRGEQRQVKLAGSRRQAQYAAKTVA